MTRRLPLRISGALALAIAITAAPHTTPFASPAIAIASEPTIDAMVEGYYYKPAPDGDKYTNSISTFAYMSKTRHMYHSAARDQHYDAAKRTSELHEIHDRSERACFIGKARVVLALMQAEGHAEARSLDISKVGIDLEESRRALPLLAESLTTHRALYNKEKNSPDTKMIDKRAKLSREGKSALEDIIKALESGSDPYEYDAFSVVNWGVSDEALHKVHHQHAMPAGMPKLEVFSASANTKVTPLEVKAMADKNRLNLAATLPMPEPEVTAVESSSHPSIWGHILTFLKYFGIAAGVVALIANFLPR